MKRSVALSGLVIFVLTGYGQPQRISGSAATHGACSPANSGDNNTFNITCGIGKEQGERMLSVLNRILSNQLDPNLVMAKLDEMAQALKKQVTTNNCPDGICVSGGIVDHPIVNNTFTTQPPPPRLTWTSENVDGKTNVSPAMDGPDSKNPGVKVTITVAGRFQFPMFALICDRACAATEIGVPGASAPKLYTTNRPDAAIAGFGGMPAVIEAGTTVWITVRSKDDQPIRVTEVGPYRPPQ